MENSYPLIRNAHGIIPTGVAVQDGNYSIINPQTGKQVTVPEILAFAVDYLKLDYILWCTEEPFYSKEVLPLISAQAPQKNPRLETLNPKRSALVAPPNKRSPQ